jgi:hypothetical protein
LSVAACVVGSLLEHRALPSALTPLTQLSKLRATRRSEIQVAEMPRVSFGSALDCVVFDTGASEGRAVDLQTLQPHFDLTGGVQTRPRLSVESSAGVSITEFGAAGGSCAADRSLQRNLFL